MLYLAVYWVQMMVYMMVSEKDKLKVSYSAGYWAQMMVYMMAS